MSRGQVHTEVADVFGQSSEATVRDLSALCDVYRRFGSILVVPGAYARRTSLRRHIPRPNPDFEQAEGFANPRTVWPSSTFQAPALGRSATPPCPVQHRRPNLFSRHVWTSLDRRDQQIITVTLGNLGR